MKNESLRGLALPLVMIGLAVGSFGALQGCAVESTPEQANAEEISDEGDDHVPDGLPEGYDDGLATSLDADLDLYAEGSAAEPEEADTSSALAAGATCDSNARNGEYCAGDKVSNGVTGTLYRCSGPGRATVVRKCPAGCAVNPGRDDSCRIPGPPSCPHVDAILRFGLHPAASDRLRCAGITSARITQTIGSAVASAGTHAQDGVASGHRYSAATDLSVRGLSDAQVKKLIARLDALGFAAFFRNPGHDGWPSSEARHAHVVFAGARMKSSLRAQIADFLGGRNGLASHTTYRFYQPPVDVKALVKKLFDAAN
jgi:hypothetical protein